MKFVELDRRFRKLNPLENLEEAALESYTASLLGLESGLGWEELLERPLVVVLGEPGSGKTWEFRERTRILRSRGENVFLIPLDRLIYESLTEILSPEENNNGVEQAPGKWASTGKPGRLCSRHNELIQPFLWS